MNKPVIFSFFSGVGFLDLGFELNNFKIEFVNEVHQPFLDAYQYSRTGLDINQPKFGYHNNDICTFIAGKECDLLKHFVHDTKKLNNLVGFIGGPPCPDFSVGGKNKGQKGKNGILTKVYVELINQHKPDFFLFENVKGLWTTKRHRLFYEEMKSILNLNGYLLTDKVINCIEYGTPQDRERILLFGIKSSLFNNSFNHNQLAEVFDWQKHTRFSKEAVFSENIWPTTNQYEVDSVLNMPESVAPYAELTIQHWFEKNQVDKHPNASNHFLPRAGLAKFKVIPEGDDSKKSYKRLHRWRYSPTAAYGNNEVHLHPYKSRRLSASEALSIQSLPKNFHLPMEMSLSNMFKAIGNGVPFLASQGIAKTLKDFLNENVTQA